MDTTTKIGDIVLDDYGIVTDIDRKNSEITITLNLHEQNSTEAIKIIDNFRDKLPRRSFIGDEDGAFRILALDSVSFSKGGGRKEVKLTFKDVYQSRFVLSGEKTGQLNSSNFQNVTINNDSKPSAYEVEFKSNSAISKASIRYGSAGDSETYDVKDLLSDAFSKKELKLSRDYSKAYDIVGDYSNPNNNPSYRIWPTKDGKFIYFRQANAFGADYFNAVEYAVSSDRRIPTSGFSLLTTAPRAYSFKAFYAMHFNDDLPKEPWETVFWQRMHPLTKKTSGGSVVLGETNGSMPPDEKQKSILKGAAKKVNEVQSAVFEGDVNEKYTITFYARVPGNSPVDSLSFFHRFENGNSYGGTTAKENLKNSDGWRKFTFVRENPFTKANYAIGLDGVGIIEVAGLEIVRGENKEGHLRVGQFQIFDKPPIDSYAHVFCSDLRGTFGIYQMASEKVYSPIANNQVGSLKGSMYMPFQKIEGHNLNKGEALEVTGTFNVRSYQTKASNAWYRFEFMYEDNTRAFALEIPPYASSSFLGVSGGSFGKSGIDLSGKTFNLIIDSKGLGMTVRDNGVLYLTKKVPFNLAKNIIGIRMSSWLSSNADVTLDDLKAFKVYDPNLSAASNTASKLKITLAESFYNDKELFSRNWYVDRFVETKTDIYISATSSSVVDYTIKEYDLIENFY